MENKVVLNFREQNIEDIDKFFLDLLNNHPDVFELDISRNPFTSLPEDLSQFNNLEVLDLTHILFDDLENVVMSLSTLPNLSQLNINLSSQHEALLILENLPKLISLNGKSTKDDTHLVDIEEKEIETINLNSELSLFHDLYKKINDMLKKVDNSQGEASKVFYDDFQKIIKNEISIINQTIESNAPTYIYANSVLSSKIKIYKYFLDILLDKILPFDKEDSIIALIKEISNIIKDNSDQLADIINKLYPRITEKTSALKTQLDQAVKDTGEIDNELKDLNNKLTACRREKEGLSAHFEDEKQLLEEKISKLEKENKYMTEKLLRRTNEILEENRASEEQLNQLNNMNNSHNSIDYKNPNNYSKADDKSQIFNNSQIIIGTRILTVKMLKDMIYEIYNSKESYDKKCNENRLPRETMEQHMYSYLNQKYGLKVSFVNNKFIEFNYRMGNFNN